MLSTSLSTPFGALRFTADDDALMSVTWGQSQPGDAENEVLQTAKRQVHEYMNGEREHFDLPVHVGGSDLVQAVCYSIAEIPFGETCTYGEIARMLGVSAQSVGAACGKNPLPIVIPCHRVMGAGGKLTGFSGEGGVETKVALLRHEKAAGLLI